jgi:hypothetical protein
VATIDVTQPGWKDIVADTHASKYYCLGLAFMAAQKVFPRHRIKRIESPSDIPAPCTPETAETPKQRSCQPVAAAVDKVVVSARHHEATEDARVWLSTYHLELIDKLVSHGCKVELLDERNIVVRTIPEDD